MKKIILSLVTLFVFTGLFAQGIKFENGTLKEALAKAKKENKIVFMDCYTTWCGPCKKLTKNIFTQKEVGDFFNKNFVNVKMDMESQAGKPLMAKYNINAFPTLLWLDVDGNVRHRTVGACDANELNTAGKIALDPENCLSALNKKFLAGERSVTFLQNFISVLSEAGCDTKAVADAYYSIKKLEQLINAEDMKLIASTVRSTADSRFQFVVKNKEAFYKVANKESIDEFIEMTMMTELFILVDEGDAKKISDKKRELISLDKKAGVKAIDFIEVDMLHTSPDRIKYYKASTDFAIKYDFDNSERLNRCAWMLAEAKEEIGKDLAEKALKMAKRSVEIEVTFLNINTYARLLNKVGLKEEAKIQAKKAIELAPEEHKENLWSSTFIAGN